MSFSLAINKQLWSDNIQKYNLGWPSENIIRFLNKNYDRAQRHNTKVLDIGCGSGRNSIAIKLLGFELYAVDFNETSVKTTEEVLAKLGGGKSEVKQNYDENIPFEDGFVDCVISWGVSFINEDIEKFLGEVNRVLGDGGLFLSNWRTTDDYFFAKGKSLGNNTFILDERAKRFGLEGMRYTFFDLDALKILYRLSGFEIYNIERNSFQVDNMTMNNDYFHIWAKKIDEK